MRFNERSFVVLVAGVLVAAAVAAIAVFALTGGGDADVEDDGPLAVPVPQGNAAAALEGGVDTVLLLSGTSIVRQTVEAPEQEVVRNVKTQSVYAAPGSSWIAYVRSAAPEEDFEPRPELVLYDLETEAKTRRGAGIAPLWNGAGTYVAFLKPVEPRNCVGEECSGDVRIGVVEAATGEAVELLDPGTYSILGWAGRHILVSDFARPDVITAVAADGETSELDFPATQYWGASPDGRWLIKTNAKKTEFVAFDDGRLGDERIPIELDDLELLEGSWSHDSEEVAAAVASRKKETTVVTFSPDEPAPELVPDSGGAIGSVLWSADNESLLFGRLLNPNKSLIQAVWCPTRNSGDCRIVISWTEGIALLRAE
ncbi:MAG: hypothetical protein M3217_11965 [Actinomycetota bacterium]|nr:hypothetical protein [Actinomycetota bacterium]